jgi:diphthine synthase
VGLGLTSDCLSLRALTILRSSDYIFLDTYTSYLPGFSLDHFSGFLDKEVTPLQREDLEGRGGKDILDRALTSKVSLAAFGDPFIATTHVWLRNTAIKRGIPTVYVPGVSIYSAAFSLVGLEIYKSGPAATIVEPSNIYRPMAAYEKVILNLRRGLHTLLLLELDVQRNSLMTFSRGAQLVAEGLESFGVRVDDLLGIGISAVGSEKQGAVASPIRSLAKIRNEAFPHCLIVPGRLDAVEAEALMLLGVDQGQLALHGKLIEELGRKIHFEY